MQSSEKQDFTSSVEALSRFADSISQLSIGYLSAGEQLAKMAEIVRDRTLAGAEAIGLLQGIVSGPIVQPPNLRGLDRLMTLGDRIGGVNLAAEITGKKAATIYKLVAEGKIPFARNGGRLQFSESALRSFAFTAPPAPRISNRVYPAIDSGAGMLADSIAAKVVEKLNERLGE